MRGRNGTWHRYYYCRNHDPIRAGGEDRRCPERNIRADALDGFVFDQIRVALTRPDLLLAGEQAVTLTTPIPDDELLAAELARLDRKIDAADAERRRLVDLYQAGLIELPELQHRAADVTARDRDLQAKRASPCTTSPTGSTVSSTNSTQRKNSSCCVCSSKRSASPAGTSRSACASPSTRHRQTHTTRKTLTTDPARSGPAQCQAKTVWASPLSVETSPLRRGDGRDTTQVR